MDSRDRLLIYQVTNELLLARVFVTAAQESLASGVCSEGKVALETAAKHQENAIRLLPRLDARVAG